MHKIGNYLILILLISCSSTHKIKIPKQPCLYPFHGYNFALCKNFYFFVKKKKFTIHRGFTTDLASVPRILWSIYSPNKTETIAGAVIHDYLYFCPDFISRQEADAIFYDALILQGISKKTAFKYWLAVRFFGHNHFNTGAICTHDYTRTKNSIGNLRLAVHTTSAVV